ncbi:hypothetical protein GT755_00115 [Herbidospora sp. NEAU-GS84]|uniref:Uncharacterized protein n=1 Tax=Herbidospora solisilvae TaxID=2696284 RepID=A0A7C9IZR1_9ACTN|nr:hypothetical protein [Herbidospora solisilvae]NAS20086.1 hypothetical protein [Herbidospora solisilvae]
MTAPAETVVRDAARELIERPLDDWIAGPMARAVQETEPADEPNLGAAVEEVLSNVDTGTLGFLAYDLDRTPEHTPWYQSPAATMAAAGRMFDFYWSLLAYLNSDLGASYGERKEARLALTEIVFQSYGAFGRVQRKAVERARETLEKGRRATGADRTRALEEAAVAANEAVMLHTVATIRLMPAALMAASWHDNGTLGDDYRKMWESIRDESRPIIDAIDRHDHETALNAWRQFDHQLGAIMPQLTEWNAQWQRLRDIKQALELTMMVASIGEFLWTVGSPPGPGLFGPPPAAVTAARATATLPVVAASSFGRSALVVAMAANATKGGGGSSAKTPPSSAGPQSQGAGQEPPWGDPRLDPAQRSRWRLLSKAQPGFANLRIRALKRGFSRLGTYAEWLATDRGDWSYRVTDRRTGITAEIDGFTGEFGPRDPWTRQTMVEVKSDQGHRTLGRDPRSPRDFDVLDEISGARRAVEDVIERRRDEFQRLKEESWSDQMRRQAEIAKANDMRVEWRVEGARKVRIAKRIRSRLEPRLRAMVKIKDITRHLEP